jgi:hypothetical protein
MRRLGVTRVMAYCKCGHQAEASDGWDPTPNLFHRGTALFGMGFVFENELAQRGGRRSDQCGIFAWLRGSNPWRGRRHPG